MRTLILGAFILGAFVAGLLIAQTGTVSAAREKKAQWQYQCFEATGIANVTKSANAMGQSGWELVTSAASGTTGQTLWCFKRPRWKPAEE